ncbi:MAG TPA: DedA family protein [Planctomycetota bacterium]|nr:DedA family protein [Planctomycetota bacterium]
MEFLKHVLDVVLHLDKHLNDVIQSYGTWTHLILFGIVFCETGLIVTPFLPGDSLLFAAGAFAAEPGNALHVGWLWAMLATAAVLGDTLNYSVGKALRNRVAAGGLRFIKPAHLQRTHAFYEKYGRKTIILARFVPIVRTFAPFVAGVGTMAWSTFIGFSIAGAIAWTGIFLFAGYFFGSMPVVKQNFPLVILAIIALSLAPIAYELLKARREAKHAAADAEP